MTENHSSNQFDSSQRNATTDSGCNAPNSGEFVFVHKLRCNDSNIAVRTRIGLNTQHSTAPAEAKEHLAKALLWDVAQFHVTETGKKIPVQFPMLTHLF